MCEFCCCPTSTPQLQLYSSLEHTDPSPGQYFTGTDRWQKEDPFAVLANAYCGWVQDCHTVIIIKIYTLQKKH